MFYKKIFLFSFLVIFGFSSIRGCPNCRIFSPATENAFISFDTGYRIGFSPLLWPFIPNIIASVKNLDPEYRTSAYVFGVAGAITSFTILGLAVYGAKKLIEKIVTNTKSTLTIKM